MQCINRFRPCEYIVEAWIQLWLPFLFLSTLMFSVNSNFPSRIFISGPETLNQKNIHTYICDFVTENRFACKLVLEWKIR